MKIPIDIHVRSERFCNDLARRGIKPDEPETDDFRVSGTMKNTKGGFQIRYTEEDGAVTTLIDVFADQTVAVNRLGPMNSHMVFADGKSHTCICNTGFFPLQMRVRTNKLENTLSMEGGKLDIDFTVEIVGNLAEKNRLTVSVCPDKSILKS